MHKTNVERRNDAWFALADAKRGRLLYCHLTKQGTQHVDEYDTLRNTLPEQEFVRPMRQSGMAHGIEGEEERRFAGKIVEWLRQNARKHEIDRLTIFAPPRMLGILRKASAGLLKGHLEELKGDLMRLDADQLAQHPMVRDLVRETHPRSLSGGSEAWSLQAQKSKVGPRNRGGPVAQVVRKAWRAGSQAAGPANAPRSHGRHGNKPGGPAGGTGRRRGDK